MATVDGEVTAISMKKFADCGPGSWWFVHLPEGRLIEIGDEETARQLAEELNIGRREIMRRLGR